MHPRFSRSQYTAGREKEVNDKIRVHREAQQTKYSGFEYALVSECVNADLRVTVATPFDLEPFGDDEMRFVSY